VTSTYLRAIKRAFTGAEDTPLVFVCNFEAEEQWARGHVGLPVLAAPGVSPLVRSMEELGVLLAGPDDHLVLSRPLDPGYRDYLRRLGFALPTVVVPERPAGSGTTTDALLGSPVALRRLAELGHALVPMGTTEAEQKLADAATLSVVRSTPIVSSRVLGRYAIKDLEIAAGDVPPPGGVDAATLPTIPLIAAVFGRVSLVSPLANLIAVPLFPPLMLAGAAILMSRRSAFRALSLGEETAQSLGVDVGRLRLSVIAGVALGVVVIAALIIVPMNFNRYGLFILSQWAVMTIAAMGLNLTLGYAGQVSLAQGAFVGIGAYAAAIMTSQGMPLIAALGVAIVLCFAIGWILGYPALRVQHHYLAFVTLAFSTLAFLVFRNEDWLTKGIYGISNIPRPSVLGFATNRPLPFYYFCLGSLAIVSLAMWWLIRSPWGRAFVALRENPVRALSLGIDTRRYTLMAFAMGSALGGVAGTLYAPLTQYIDPVPFNLSLSLDLLMMVIVGGSGFFFGPFLGAMIAVLLPEWLRFTQGYYLMLYAVAVMLLLIYSPTGILGILDRYLAERRTKAASALRAVAKSRLETAP